MGNGKECLCRNQRCSYGTRAAADGREIVLVGDAEAFFYLVPMRLLHYKTVFDLPAGETEPLHAWGGTKADSLLIHQHRRDRSAASHLLGYAGAAGELGEPQEEPMIVKDRELRLGWGK